MSGTRSATGSSTRSQDDEVMFEFVRDFGDLDRRHAAPVPRSQARRARVRSSRSSRRAPRSSPSTGTAARRSCSTQLGAGSTVLCTYPLEHMAARTPRVNPEDTWRLYSALAADAGVSRPVRVDDPRVLVGRVRRRRRRDHPLRQLLERHRSRSSRSSRATSHRRASTPGRAVHARPVRRRVAAGEAVAAGRVGSAATFEHIVRDGQPAIAVTRRE